MTLATQTDRIIDARGMPCPGPLMALIGAIRESEVGDAITVLSTSTSSWRALRTQARISVLEPWSVERTVIASPTSLSRIAPIRAIRGPGQGMPRASMIRSVCVASVIVPTSSDECHRAVGRGDERGHTLHVVDQGVEVVLRDAEHLHRERAGVNAHLADLLRLAEELAPVLGPLALHELVPPLAGLGGHPVVLEHPVGAERVEGPVLEEHVHLAAHGRRSHGQHTSRVQLVVG